MVEVERINGDHVCMVQQKYNITKRVKYRAPMSVRTYEWCFSMPPRCSKWSTEMRDLTRLETEERTAEVAVCCPGYKMRDVSCVPVCPPGRTGNGCSEDCPKSKWGPNCVNECKTCTEHGTCSAVTGECRCQDGWQGERCEVRLSSPATIEELSVTKPVTIPTSRADERTTMTSTTGTTTTTTPITTTVRIPITAAPTKTTLPTTPKPTTTTTTTIPTTTTMRPIATTLLTSAATSTVETTIQSSKIATVESKIPNQEPTTTKYTNWNNVTLTTPWILSTNKSIAPTKMSFTTVSPIFIKPSFATKSIETTTASTKGTTVRKSLPTTEFLELPSQSTKTFEMSTMTLRTAKPNLITEPTIKEATRRPETTIKMYPTTIKFKPKEIWIRPAQKGELLVETKIKPISEPPKHKNVTKKETTINTTPRTIMVSIIPTSLSYATFKKIALTTASYFTYKNVTGKSTEMFTRSMSSTPAPVRPSSTSTPFQNTTKSHFTEDSKNATNSMRTSAKPLTISSTNTKLRRINRTSTKTLETVTEIIVKRNNTVFQAKDNVTKITATAKPDEEFHILTEPEHITAVMDKPDRSSVDLISVISIAGGVMMTVITVAVVIVMLDRCKRPRYEDKMNSIKMQVMIDNNDGPPPYVRNIFNTPLPEPPRTEKCHYQPISTLDRNLKQFMRPVVVQTISPMMLENFRGILECHYDHLPRRSVEYPTLQARCSVAPSLSGCDELRQQRPDSLAESAIEALKCEAKLDVIDNTTSEPLYAEIPCWRPPSEHAIEVVNLNGEAVTEL
ncbi:mucin-5AC-like isoform X2 [Cydia strobilella]|uniref:mucin-5AC-like isoform X2 n=1 Tax=Cydia strobilella TaxID=1100964 RepID=UPI0030049A40